MSRRSGQICVKLTAGKYKRESAEQKHGQCVGQTVGHHRAEYSGEWRVLTLGYVAGAPQFAKTWQNKVHGIASENRQYQIEKRRTHSTARSCMPQRIPRNMWEKMLITKVRTIHQ